MELDEIAGLPAHPLFVHVPVVLIPIAGIIALVFAIKSGWLDRFGWGLVALSGVGMIGAILAAGSGEGLEDRLRRNGEEITNSLREHAEMGETARTMSVLLALAAAGATYTVADAGHSGATEVWNEDAAPALVVPVGGGATG